MEPWWVKTLFRYVSRRRALGLGPPFAAGERGEAGVDAIAGAPARAAAAAAAPFGGGGAAVVLFQWAESRGWSWRMMAPPTVAGN